jgi:hypothetical protein
MPLQNRVSPEGDIVATPARGEMFGVRGGCFHRPDQTLKTRPYAGKQWICCVLDFKNRRRKMMQPGLYTELFFLDEATAFSAGHRPCFFCRHEAAVTFAQYWNAVRQQPGRARAPDMDEVLHGERINARHQKITHQSRFDQLPDGTFVRWNGRPALWWGQLLHPWSFEGYGPPQTVAPAARGQDDAEVLTPPGIIAILALGLRPTVHGSAHIVRDCG